MGKPQIYKYGTYYVDSNVTITPTNDDQNEIFSCRVRHDSLQEPLQRDFLLVYEDIPYHNIPETPYTVVIVVCILVLITIIAVVIGIFLWWRKYRKKGNTHENLQIVVLSGMKIISIYTMSSGMVLDYFAP
ncbi:unnamed protein product [Staurois parvus]|uniref:Uncharacterized protein n=1 Tax=Staurois parvus TaxID=386267 RepID=A0ABN9GT67_9NEOB|nr:unnamed protein product [Staurois parvus]